MTGQQNALSSICRIERFFIRAQARARQMEISILRATFLCLVGFRRPGSLLIGIFKPTISKLSSDPMQGGRQRVSNRVQQPPSPNAQTTSLCSFYNSSMFPHSLSFPPLLCSCFVRYNILLELCVPSYLYGILVCNLWNKDYLFAFLAPKSER